MSTAAEKQFDQGLVNTIVAETAMSYIDGENGVLEYVGIDIDSLARNSTFEETTYLLWNRRLPNASELAEFEASLRAEYVLPEAMLDMIRAMPAESGPMHAVQHWCQHFRCSTLKPMTMTPTRTFAKPFGW